MVSLPDNGGILDALAHLRGTQTLLTDLIDSPQDVMRCLEKMTVDYLDSLFRFFDVIKENNLGGSSHGWMNTWCPGTHVQMQVDFSVMLSPGMYEQFALPELHRISSAVDHTIYHLDGQEQIRHLDMILSVPGIDLIQWATVEGQPKTSRQMETLKRIQKAGKGLVLMPQPDEVGYLLSELSCKGLILIVNGIKTPEEADDLIAFAEKQSHL